MSKTTARRLTLTIVISLFVYALACYSPICWSPDGKSLAFIQYAEGEKDEVLSELWVVGVSSGKGERIALGEAGLSAPAWSPDGGSIAYLCIDAESLPDKLKKDERLRAAAVLYDMNTRQAKKLCDIFLPSEGNRGELAVLTSEYQPNWSADGTRIAFDCVAESGKPRIMTSDRSGKAAVLIENAMSPQWSPDGRWIACIAVTSGVLGTEMKVVAVRPDGGDKQTIADFFPAEKETSREWRRLAWAPNSKQLAFTSLLKKGAKEHAIFLTDADGKTTPLVRGDENHILGNPMWTKDGTQIAFVRHDVEGEGEGELKSFSIVLFDMRNGKENVLVKLQGEGDGEVADLSWSPDGKWLAYRWRGKVIKVLRSDGGEAKVLTADPTSLLTLADACLNAAKEAYSREDYAASRQSAKQAIAHADEFLRRFPSSGKCGDAMAAKACCLRLLNRPQEAADLLDSMPLRKPDEEAEGRLQSDLAECQVALGQYSDALAIWDGLVELCGDSPVGKEARKRGEEIRQALGNERKLTERLAKKRDARDCLDLAWIYYGPLPDPKKAADALQGLLKDFPKGKDAEDAKDLLKKVREKFATD